MLQLGYFDKHCQNIDMRGIKRIGSIKYKYVTEMEVDWKSCYQARISNFYGEKVDIKMIEKGEAPVIPDLDI